MSHVIVVSPDSTYRFVDVVDGLSFMDQVRELLGVKRYHEDYSLSSGMGLIVSEHETPRRDKNFLLPTVVAELRPELSECGWRGAGVIVGESAYGGYRSLTGRQATTVLEALS